MAKPFAKAFYKSKAWERARKAALIRDRGMCTTPGCFNPAEEVHHIIHLTPENITDAAVALDLKNLQCLCRGCHMRMHDADRFAGEKKENNILPGILFINGRPIERK